jgi:nucleotide-binding universal stress UspA family protein
MSVAVAHKVSPSASLLIAQAGREAALRQTNLIVIEVIDSLDLDIAEAHRAGLLDTARQSLQEAGQTGVEVDVRVATGTDDIASAVLDVAKDVDAEILVIGARHRSPVGKLLLGSSTQRIILDAELPVLVVKVPE